MVSPSLVSGLLTALITAVPERAVLLEAQFEPEQVYVQAQAIYRLRLYQAIDVRDAAFSVAAPRLADMRPLGTGRVYEVLRDGRRYRVHERSYAIRPYTSGALVLSGVHVDAWIPTAGTPSGRRALRMDAPARTLQVLPAPPSVGASSWLPAHALSLTEVWAPPPYQVGQAQRRTIRIEAVGIDAGQLPELQIVAPEMAVHAEPARLENRLAGELNIGIREQTFDMVALRAGAVIVPEFQLAWWNVDSNVAAMAALPARAFQFAPVSGPANGPLPASATAPAEPRRSLLSAGVASLLCCTAALLWHRRRHIGLAWVLARACQTGDARGARDALLAWTAMVRPQSAAGTLGGLAARLDEPAARHALGELDRHLYGRERGACDRAALAAIVRSVKRAVRRAP